MNPYFIPQLSNKTKCLTEIVIVEKKLSDIESLWNSEDYQTRTFNFSPVRFNIRTKKGQGSIAFAMAQC